MDPQDRNKITGKSLEESFLSSDLNSTAVPLHLRERLIQSYLAVVFLYKGLISIVALLVIASTVYITLKTPKKYTAFTVVGMGSYVPSTEIALARMLRADMQGDTFVQNQLTTLDSLGIARKALGSDPEIAKYLMGKKTLPLEKLDKNGNLILPEFNVNLLKKYLAHTSHELIRGSTMVRIKGYSTSPDMAARIANAQARAFVSLSQEQLFESASIHMKVLSDRLKEKRRVVEEKNRAIKEYVSEYAHIINNSRSSTNNVIDIRLRNLVNALGSAVVARATSEAQFRELRSSRVPNGLGLDGRGHGKYAQLQKNLDDYRQLKKDVRDPNHRWLREKKQEIEMTRTELKLARQQKLLDAGIAYRANLEREALLQQEFNQLKEELKKGESDLAEEARIRLEYSILQAELASAKLIYGELAKRMEEAQLVTNKEQLTVKIVDQAMPPTHPSSPNVRFNILMGCVFGLLLGIALAYILAFMDNSIRTTEQLTCALGIKIMGVIPSFSRRRHHDAGRENRTKGTRKGSGPRPKKEQSRTDTVTLVKPSGKKEKYLDFNSVVSDLIRATALKTGETKASSSDSLLLLETPHCMEAEAFRSLRTSVLHSLKDDSSKVLLVSSGQPLDGKTTVISNLAISFGQTGKKTVLIDADVRKPTLHNRFGLSPDQPGLSEYLTGECEIKDILATSPVDSLWLIPAGNAEMSPGELLASKKMEELVKTLSKDFDLVLMDSPPLSHISDALLLSKFSDGVLFVVRSGRTPRPVAEHAVSRLKQLDARILGMVLNDLKRSSSYGDAAYYYLRDYYSNEYYS